MPDSKPMFMTTASESSSKDLLRITYGGGDYPSQHLSRKMEGLPLRSQDGANRMGDDEKNYTFQKTKCNKREDIGQWLEIQRGV